MSETLSRPAVFLRELIRCPSVTPEEGGALSLLERELCRLGFEVKHIRFSDDNTPDVENLYARVGDSAPHLMFAGHTDVVPPGNPEDWHADPFAGVVENGIMFGRGAVDMKGGIACFLAAVEAYLNENVLNGSISFLITGDEEGPAVNGTDKLLKWAAEAGEVWDAAIVGEPSNTDVIGDVIKNGRRGSLSGRIIVDGKQGHVAYPHLADNPVRGLMDLLSLLLAEPLDNGSDNFQPTNLEVISIDVGNPATNVIPGQTTATFNVRFNDQWTGETLRAEIIRRLDTGSIARNFRQDKSGPVRFEVEWIGRVSDVFLTSNDKLVGTLSASIKNITGNRPNLSTGGGTSDARFIKQYCPVVEFGLVGRSMHQVDEQTPLSDLDALTAIYLDFLRGFFDKSNG